MKIAFTTKGSSWESDMDPRFGRSEHILIYDDTNQELTHIDNREVASDAHGAGPKTVQKLFGYHPDIIITGNGPGRNALAVLEKAGIKIYTGAGEMKVMEAYDAFKNNTLHPF